VNGQSTNYLVQVMIHEVLHEGEKEKEGSKDEAKRTHLERDNQCQKQRQNPYLTGWIRGQVAPNHCQHITTLLPLLGRQHLVHPLPYTDAVNTDESGHGATRSSHGVREKEKVGVGCLPGEGRGRTRHVALAPWLRQPSGPTPACAPPRSPPGHAPRRCTDAPGGARANLCAPTTEACLRWCAVLAPTTVAAPRRCAGRRERRCERKESPQPRPHRCSALPPRQVARSRASTPGRPCPATGPN
jgi:hypothetical protein